MLKKFVIVKHMADNGKFLFFVPENVDLPAGKNVICDTSRGNYQLGICCCDSFIAEQETVMPLFGTCEKAMKYVKGTVEYVTFAESGEKPDEQ